MLSGTVREILIILVLVDYNVVVFGQYYSGEGPSTTPTGCFTPDYTQGLCVPMAKCRRIEWMLQNWSPPYPAHIARYMRQSHCGSQGDVHFACCALYDIRDHYHYSHQPPQIPKPSPSPTFIRNPHQAYHSSQTPVNPPIYTSDPLDFHHRPKVNYLQQPVGERILRSIACGPLNGDRISNGEIVRLSEFPWVVLLESEGVKSRQRFRCAGTLITNQYVLTAAHCVDSRNEVISVRLGEHDLRTEHDCENQRKSRYASNCAPPYEDVAIETIIKHPDYKLHPLKNDIALIRLQRPVEFNSHIKAICLPLDAHITAQIPTEQIVAGWGVTEKGYASEVLLKANVPLQSFEVCQTLFAQNRMSTSEHLCAGGVEKRNTCRADSGGPLFAAVPYEHHHQMRYVQFGITSAGGFSCGSKHNMPGIYTNVGSYITWIISTIY